MQLIPISTSAPIVAIAKISRYTRCSTNVSSTENPILGPIGEVVVRQPLNETMRSPAAPSNDSRTIDGPAGPGAKHASKTAPSRSACP